MWQVRSGQCLRHHDWGDEAVVFNDLSGDTHLLGADAMAILFAVQAGPLSLSALSHTLGAGDAREDDVASILDDLEQIALVEYIEC